jgi:hypothetical protein
MLTALTMYNVHNNGQRLLIINTILFIVGALGKCVLWTFIIILTVRSVGARNEVYTLWNTHETLFLLRIKSFKRNGGAITSFRRKRKLLNVSSSVLQHVWHNNGKKKGWGGGFEERIMSLLSPQQRKGKNCAHYLVFLLWPVILLYT